MCAKGELKYRLNPKLAIRKVEEIYLIITPDSVLHKIETPSGVFILDLFSEGPRSVNEVINEVEKNFELPEDKVTAVEGIKGFLKELRQKDIIEEI